MPVLFTYATNSGAITITKYIGIDGAATIPDSVNGLPVTGIRNFAFYQCTSLTNITVGSNVTSIAGQAFVGCPNLIVITVDALNSIYSSVNGVLFDKMQDTLIFCPNGRAGSYKIPDTVSSIAVYGFQHCSSLTSVTFPVSMNSIGTLAFDGCNSITAYYFLGNAPNPAFEAFDVANNAIVYYLPGTTGWSTNFEGYTTVVWNPQAQTSDGSFGVQNNQFGFNITGNSNLVVVVEVCTNLANPVWQPVATTTLTGGASYFSDPQWTNYPSRFYSIQMP